MAATRPPEGKLDTDDELTFHPDFTTSVDGVILQSDDGTSFQFDLDMLCICSSFFRDLRDMPLNSSQAGVKVIPLPSATTPGLALTLNLVRGHILPSQRPPTPWPSNDTIDNLLDIVSAYDLPLAVDAFLVRTKRAVSRQQCCQRLVVSFGLGFNKLHSDVYGMAVLHGLDDADDWVKGHIESNILYTVSLQRLNAELQRLMADAERSATQALLATFADYNAMCTQAVKSVHIVFQSGLLPGLLLEDQACFPALVTSAIFSGDRARPSQVEVDVVCAHLRNLWQKALCMFGVVPHTGSLLDLTHL
ncbi:uncharacterized protein LOC62_04G006577 [Vanrija pseudolonga]|uniref:BTB domain-containing protein n=1 Tax=Vanrija pseudolonga TaxID=143232 RepID=A0AAF1BJ74_9TREE|nr:hypothetical protein LOC62_04G006577 [Vanrija pseudolonga]